MTSLTNFGCFLCVSLLVRCLRQNRLLAAAPSQWTSQDASLHSRLILVCPLPAEAQTLGAQKGAACL